MFEITEKDLLLVIDMQNVYLPGSPWGCERIREAVSYIQDVIKRFPEEQRCFTGFLPQDHPDGVWKEYNKQNQKINRSEWMNDYIEELKPYITDENFYAKSKYSCLKNEELKKRIDSYERIFVTGVVAECCVLSTVMELIDRGKKVMYMAEGIAGVSREKERMVIQILEGMSPLHIIFLRNLPQYDRIYL